MVAAAMAESTENNQFLLLETEDQYGVGLMPIDCVQVDWVCGFHPAQVCVMW